MIPRKLRERALIILCPSCDRIKKHEEWVEIEKDVIEEWKRYYHCVIKYECCQICIRK